MWAWEIKSNKRKEGNVLQKWKAIKQLWCETKKLWKEDREAYEQKKIVKLRRDYSYSIKWDKRNALFKNKTIYRFLPVRSLSKKTIENMCNKMGDAIPERRNKYIL